jgi:hypothetical protein
VKNIRRATRRHFSTEDKIRIVLEGDGYGGPSRGSLAILSSGLTPSNDRHAAERNDLRYPSDLTDAEWALVEPMILPGRHGGRKRSVNVREVLNGIFYVLWTGCQWKALQSSSTIR